LYFYFQENGGEGLKVGELSPEVCFELEAYLEPKVLTKTDLKALMGRFRSTVKVAKHVGASQAFVWSQIQT
jgi:hypothetical protein